MESTSRKYFGKIFIFVILIVFMVFVGILIFFFKSNTIKTTNHKASDPQLLSNCKEFEDISKNYAIGEIIVEFSKGTSLDQQISTLQMLGGTVKEKLLVENFYIIQVKPGQEINFINKTLKYPNIKSSELNGCNNKTVN